MPLDRLINILVTVTLIEMMVLIGLRVTFAEIANTARSWPLVARAVAANYLLVPVLAIVLLILFAASPMVAVGFLVLAVCPGAPYGPPFAGIARANVPEAVGLMVVLAGSSAVVSPLLLQVLLPLVAGGEAARIDPFGMMSALLITQLLPLLLGLLVRHRRPQLGETARPVRTRQQAPEPECGGADLGHPVPYAGADPDAWLRRHAHPAGREPGHRLVRRRTGNR